MDDTSPLLVSTDAVVLRLSAEGTSAYVDVAKGVADGIVVPLDSCVWVPRTKLHETNALEFRPDARGVLVVERGWAKKKGIIP